MSDTSDSRRAFRLLFVLAIVDVFAVFGAVAPFAPVISEQPFRLLVTLPLLIFLPGYAVITALFPTGDGGQSPHSDEVIAGRFDGLERFVFAVGTSVLVVAGIALVLDFSGIGIRPIPVTISASACTLVASVVAVIRRRALTDERYLDSVSAWRGEFRRQGRTSNPARSIRSLLGARLNVILVVLILASVGSIGFALAGLDQTESYTTMSLLTENGSEMVPADGQALAERDSPGELVVGLENHEGNRVRYTVVVQRQQVAPDDPTTVRERTTLDTFRVTLADGERRRTNYSVPPSVAGKHHRIVFLLFKGEVPPTPTMDDATQETHLWVTPENESRAAHNGERG